MAPYDNLAILIVDKEESSRQQIAAQLSKQYWVWTFDKGKEALAKLENSQADILISSLRLKDMDGIDFINRVKKIYSQIYVIIASRPSLLSKKMEPLREIASDFIPKPINEEQLNLVMKRAVNHQQLLKRKEFYRELSILDHLTRVYNRRYLDLQLAREIERSRRLSHSFSVLILDIDNFKLYNDRNGHPAGDVLLQKFANLLKNSSRMMDSVFRYGGDEFLVLFPETSKKDAIHFAWRIEATINKEKFKGIETFPSRSLSSSTGLASFPEDGLSAEALLSAADRRMYKAKKQKNNKVCFID